MNRRGFLLGALAAPLVVRTPGVLMPVRHLIPPGPELIEFDLAGYSVSAIAFRASIEDQIRAESILLRRMVQRGMVDFTERYE